MIRWQIGVELFPAKAPQGARQHGEQRPMHRIDRIGDVAQEPEQGHDRQRGFQPDADVEK